MKLSIVTTALVGLVTAQDLSKYHLSWCANKTIWHSSGVLTGLERDEPEQPYSRCVYTIMGKALFDYHCLCSAGDGEGSAIMSMALEIGHVWAKCGWNEMMCTSFVSFFVLLYSATDNHQWTN